MNRLESLQKLLVFKKQKKFLQQFGSRAMVCLMALSIASHVSFAGIDESQLITMEESRKKFSYLSNHWNNHGLGLGFGVGVTGQGAPALICFYDYLLSSPIREHSQLHLQLLFNNHNPSLSTSSAEVQTSLATFDITYRLIGKSGWFSGFGLKLAQHSLDYNPNSTSLPNSTKQSFSGSSMGLSIEFGIQNYGTYYWSTGIQLAFLSTSEAPEEVEQISTTDDHRDEVKSIWLANQQHGHFFIGLGYYLEAN